MMTYASEHEKELLNLMPLFTEVRGRVILRASALRSSKKKFAGTEF
jgi:hypothetical protein